MANRWERSSTPSATGSRRASSGSPTTSNSPADCTSTRGPPGRCARARACCRSASPAWKANSCAAAVACLDPEGREIGRGLINYSAAEARAILGLPSNQIAERLGHVDEPELIHRDNFVRTG